jgi:hypothetical protein
MPFIKLTDVPVAEPASGFRSGRAITDCRVIDVWHPPREDYR